MSNLQLGLITVEGEAKKVISSVRANRLGYATKSSNSDLKKYKFDAYKPGLFVAVLPINSTGNIDAVNADKANQVMSKLRSVKLNDEFMVLSAGCSYKFAKEHFEDVHSTFKTAAIAFSTPENLQILSEDPANY